MPEMVISDTSCLIVLSNINELHLLKSLYNNIITTPEVAKEFGASLPDWINIESANDPQTQKILELQVDKGEASAIALAINKPGCIVILDDYKARVVAEGLNVKITGTIGIIVKAKLKGIIPSVKPVLSKIKQTNFRITKAIEEFALKEANEN